MDDIKRLIWGCAQMSAVAGDPAGRLLERVRPALHEKAITNNIELRIDKT